MGDFELVWDSRCGVAESPVWDAAGRRLLFCDINGKRINALTVEATTAPTVTEKSPVISSARQTMLKGAPRTPVPSAASAAMAAVPGCSAFTGNGTLISVL